MTIRPANHGDINGLTDLLEWAFQEGPYAGLTVFDRKAAKEFLLWGINNMGRRGKKCFPSIMWLAETSGIVSGILLATVHPVYQIGTVLCAQEIYWFGRAGVAEPKDISDLFTKFETWAEADERVIEIKGSSSDAISPNGRWREMKRFYTRRGFEPCGEVFVRRIKR